MADYIPIIRGQTVTTRWTYNPVAGGLANLTGMTLKSDFKDYLGNVHHLTTSLDNTGLIVTISDTAENSATYAPGLGYVDLRYSNGTVNYTHKVPVKVTAQVTVV